MRLKGQNHNKNNFDDMIQKLSNFTENSVLERFNKSNNLKQKSFKLKQEDLNKGPLIPTRHSVNVDVVKHDLKIKTDDEH